MKHISMAGDAVLTEDRMADAVMEYARALARSGSADSVTFPVLGPTGEVEDASMLLGPASQITITEADHDEVKLPVDEALADVRGRTELLVHPHGVVGVEEPDDGNPFVAFDDYLD